MSFSALAWEIAEMIKSKKFMSAAIYVSATFAFGMGLFFIASEILIKWNF